MTKQQLIQAMTLLGFVEGVHYEIGNDYDSIQVIEGINKPSLEDLTEIFNNSTVPERIQALGDLSSLIGLYIKDQQLDEDDSFNLAGFTPDKINTNFGWSFKNVPKPTLGQLESLVEERAASSSSDLRLKNALKAQEVGALCVAKVWSINEGKEISAEQFNAILNDATLQRIERLLWNGSLKTAKALIQGLGTQYFSADEKNEILQIITDSGLA